MVPTPGKQPTPGRAVPKPSATPPPSLPLPTPASPTQAASRGRSAETCVGCARDVRGNRADGMCVGTAWTGCAWDAHGLCRPRSPPPRYLPGAQHPRSSGGSVAPPAAKVTPR